MASGDVYRLSVQSTFTGTDQIVNVFHYRQVVGVTIPVNPAEALISNWQGDVKPSYLACLSGRITLQTLEVVQVTGGTEAAEVADTDNGTLPTGDITPLQTAPLISWRTGQTGRRRRGRTYMPPIPETEQDGGQMIAGMITALETFAEAALAVELLGVDQFELVIYSPEDLEATPPRPGTIITPVTAFIVRDVMATQRRRRQGSGS